MKPSKRRIERAAKAIRFLVPLAGENNFEIKGNALAGWTPKGLAQVKWPKDFGPDERKLIRRIARVALTAGKQ